MAFNARYITYPIVTDTRDLIGRAFDYLKTRIPGWQPSEGQLDVWMIEALGIEAAEIATLTSQVPKAIFRYFGSTIFGVLPIDATPAIVYSTWFFTDTLAHTITAGTQVGIRNSAGNLIPFQVLSDAQIGAGPGQTTSGQILLVAMTPGVEGTGLGVIGANVELMDTLSWVDHVTQLAVTTGGQDAESDDAYLTRLSLQLQTMSPRPILPKDFQILATNIAGIQRAAVLDGYNPANATFGNERMVAVVPVDSAGQPVAVGIKTALDAYYQGMREINFVVNIIDPTMSRISVVATVLALPGYDATDVDTRVTAAVENFLHPKNWGVSVVGDNPNNPVTWNNTTTIYFQKLQRTILDVPGVDRTTVLTDAVFGGGQASVDIVLNGVVPLPFTQAGDVNITVILP